LAEKLRPQLLEPEVQIRITEYRSQPVSVLGAVGSPGLQTLRGPTPIAELLSKAGGLRTDASDTLLINRRKAPGAPVLPGAFEDPSGEYHTVELHIPRIMAGNGPEANVLVYAHDVITVPRADVVYVIGEVKRSGGFQLGSGKSASVLQALAMAEGMTPAASPKKAMLLRPVPGGTREEIALDLPGIIKGRAEDVRLKPNDILFIPDSRSAAKTVAARALQASVAVLSGVAIWRLGR
jgi:polysaccharide export outer membrane protein